MKILWTEALDAHYGVNLNQKAVEVWEHYLKQFSVGNAELVKVIEEASKRSEPTRSYRVTVFDLIEWVSRSRCGWQKKGFNCDHLV